MGYKVNDEVLIKARIKDMSYVDMVYVCELVTNPDVCIRFKIPTECIVTEKTYETGLNDAWNLLKKVYDMKCDAIEEIFGVECGFYDVIRNFTFEDCRDKIEAYEKEKSVCVGDVVEDEEGTKALVIDKGTENIYFVFTENGCVEEWHKRDLKKTGKKISIESLLKQIGE